MSDTMKAAWIGAVFVVLAAVITGVLTWLGGSGNRTEGDCSSIISGTVSGTINQDCRQEGQE